MQRLTQSILRLELFEVVGLLSFLSAIVIFVSSTHRLAKVYGIHATDSALLNNLVGVFESRMPWLFVLAFTMLSGVYLALRSLRHKHPQTADTLMYLVRILFAFILLMAIYKIANFYIALFNPFDRDAAIQHIDRAMFFGKLPSQWLEPYISKPLTDLFSTAYMSWFFLTYLTVLVMLLRGREAMRQYVSMAMFTFYIGYLTYVLVPVIGPIFTVPYTHPLGGIEPFFAHDQALISRDCFPSLHTGIAIVMAVSVWRNNRKWSWFYIPITALIIMSTIYMRFHYALDVIAGIGLSVAMAQLSPLYVRGWAAFRARFEVELRARRAETVSDDVYSELA